MKLNIKSIMWCVSLALFSCNSAPEDDGGFITSSGGDEVIEDTTSMNVEYDLLEQPLSVRLFFELTDEQLGTDYCFDRAQVENLIMGEGPDEFTWTGSQITENYLLFENNECFVTTEFVIRGDGPNMWAMLLQSSKNGQQVDVFGWNEGGRTWHDLDYPKPDMWDFYYSLEDPEQVWVEDYGYYYAYMENEGKEISYVFSTWQMGLNADGKEIMDFNKEPDFSFELMEDEQEGGFWLKKNYENKDLTPDRYFLGYTETGETTEDFSWFYDDIEKTLAPYGVEAAFADFTQTNYKGFFSTDTFDYSAMQQFEPRNGFWFYERGKEPLDMEVDESGAVLQKAKRYFDEKGF